MADSDYDRRAAAFIADLRRKAHQALPADQADDLVADIAEHLVVAGRSTHAPGDVFGRLGTPEALVRDAVGASEGTPRRRGWITRIRNARTVAPELLALVLLYLACFGAQRGQGPGSWKVTPAGAFLDGLLIFISPVLLVAGGVLLSLSRRITWVPKAVSVVSAIFFPVSLVQIAPHLAGWHEMCDSGSSGIGGKVISSYSYCTDGPNGTTHLVEWTWVLLPLVIVAAIGMLVVIRDRRAKGAPAAPTPMMIDAAG